MTAGDSGEKVSGYRIVAVLSALGCLGCSLGRADRCDLYAPENADAAQEMVYHFRQGPLQDDFPYEAKALPNLDAAYLANKALENRLARKLAPLSREKIDRVKIAIADSPQNRDLQIALRCFVDGGRLRQTGVSGPENERKLKQALERLSEKHGKTFAASVWQDRSPDDAGVKSGAAPSRLYQWYVEERSG